MGISARLEGDDSGRGRAVKRISDAIGELDWPSFDTHFRKTAAGCGYGMATFWAGKYYFSRSLR
jgi:hypothetical protein